MSPSAQFDVEDTCAAGPWDCPFVLVVVDTVDVWELRQGCYSWLFLGLASQKVCG